jgi:hypothetical protein
MSRIPNFVPADTRPEAAWVQFRIYQRMAPEKRLELAFQMSDFLRRTIREGVRHRHPDFADEQVKLAVCRLTLGEEVFAQAFPGVTVKV